jgi:2-polyprenyl-3-methyl-5-hydroxy-6-metoxy-1,4-benzoquinol methylase
MSTPQTAEARSNFESMIDWFRLHGGTDEQYLKTCWDRFQVTWDFIRASIAPESTILDIGSHWLHLAMPLAIDGHKLICADVGSSQDMPQVQSAAHGLGIDLVTINRLDEGDGISGLPESSVDAVIFSEIIEHLAFNPVRMWQKIYRVLRPGGKVFVTTPNSLHFERLHAKLGHLFSHGEYGINIREVIEIETYGHHWKEFSIPELRRYFTVLSPDFVPGRAVAVTPYQTPEVVAYAYSKYLKDKAVIADLIPLEKIVDKLEKIGAQPMGQQILMEIDLPTKNAGIVAKPGWWFSE